MTTGYLSTTAAAAMRQPFGVTSEMAGSGPCVGKRSMPRRTFRRTLRRITLWRVESPAEGASGPAKPRASPAGDACTVQPLGPRAPRAAARASAEHAPTVAMRNELRCVCPVLTKCLLLYSVEMCGWAARALNTRQWLGGLRSQGRQVVCAAATGPLSTEMGRSRRRESNPLLVDGVPKTLRKYVGFLEHHFSK
jgi:hypothetical protein